jgi:hypothetical protein
MAGELAQRETERVREHLSACPGCARELAELEELYKKLDRMEDIQPSPGFEAQFWRKVKETRQAKVPEPSRQWLPGPFWTFNWKLGLSAALVALVVFGGYMGFQTLKTQREPVGHFEMAEMAEIAKDLDFYRNYEVIEVMDNLLGKEEAGPDEGNSSENHTL